MNYGLIRLEQETGGALKMLKDERTKKTAMGVLPGRSHSGDKIGILGSVTADDDGSHPTVKWTLRCLEVASAAAYNRLVKELDDLTVQTQHDEHTEKGEEALRLRTHFHHRPLLHDGLQAMRRP